jgi:hypothetical protein
MRTRSLMLGIAFVLLATIPVQADLSVSGDADYLQFPMELRPQHQSAIRPVDGLITIHASTLLMGGTSWLWWGMPLKLCLGFKPSTGSVAV